MTDPKPADTPLTPERITPDLDRDAKIDALLLAGLEHYFGGRYQEAVNVWERVLFLDRAHARARAYIDRARGALAERQRKTEELVGEGMAALGRGDGGAARQLLTRAVENGDPHDLAVAHLDRLNRLSPDQPPSRRLRRRPIPAPAADLEDDEASTRMPRPVRALPIIGAALVMGVVIIIAASRDWLRPFVASGREPAPAGPALALPPDPVPAPRPAEIALARSRDLLRAGHMKAALAALDGVPVTDPLAPEALRLRADLQRVLLGLPVEEAEPSGEPALEPRGAEVRK
jgi:tetratricopeptide (TPR) repeat protein